MTIILGLPSKILGFIAGVVEGLVISTVVLMFLSLLFCGLLVYVGRKKGVTSLISILVTCVLIINSHNFSIENSSFLS